MFRNIRRKIATLVSALTLVAVPLAVPALVAAQPTIQECLAQGSSLEVQGNADCDSVDSNTSGSTDSINKLIRDVINIFSIIVGVVSVIMIIIGGFRYITSGGDSNHVSSAKNTIIYAIIGLVIVALAQFIVQFVLNKVAGS